MRSTTKRQLRRMTGEFFREVAVLIFVLAPLEALVAHGRLTWAGGATTLIVGGCCSAAGLWLGLEEK